ncbi:hypothetical protein BDA96_01G227500 [Sorghum bicolor]|uniref:Uncharacterized protein n=2 Tax=Sorghum bicolor TaxID=4558 RepID=A0A921V101_SORBI|nr:hypothetical protein BDA96_01G227500 [Sorghum bicolor]OQU91608.1 hypothetical protein SORBI_3001G213150 [Sorghum bicolor]
MAVDRPLLVLHDTEEGHLVYDLHLDGEEEETLTCFPCPVARFTSPQLWCCSFAVSGGCVLGVMYDWNDTWFHDTVMKVGARLRLLGEAAQPTVPRIRGPPRPMVAHVPQLHVATPWRPPPQGQPRHASHGRRHRGQDGHHPLRRHLQLRDAPARPRRRRRLPCRPTAESTGGALG